MVKNGKNPYSIKEKTTLKKVPEINTSQRLHVAKMVKNDLWYCMQKRLKKANIRKMTRFGILQKMV